MQAVKKLKQELRAFHNTGLKALLNDLENGRESVESIPGRGTWRSCPLSYRLGSRGSVDKDTGGVGVNAFTEAWDGLNGMYLDEVVVIREVKAEIQRRQAKQKPAFRGRAVPRRALGSAA